MLAFVPGNEKIKGDLSMILRSSPEDMPGMIRSYVVAVGSKAKVVTLVDERIEGDPIWSNWAEQLLQEIQDIARFCSVSTEVGIPESFLVQNSKFSEYGSASFDEALLNEFFSIIANIAVRLTSGNDLNNNKDELPTNKGESA
jgi:hypothetical protein